MIWITTKYIFFDYSKKISINSIVILYLYSCIFVFEICYIYEKLLIRYSFQIIWKPTIPAKIGAGTSKLKVTRQLGPWCNFGVFWLLINRNTAQACLFHIYCCVDLTNYKSLFFLLQFRALITLYRMQSTFMVYTCFLTRIIKMSK